MNTLFSKGMLAGAVTLALSHSTVAQTTDPSPQSPLPMRLTPKLSSLVVHQEAQESVKLMPVLR